MAPGGGGKRKRGDRTYPGDSRDDGPRPSPHRPGSLTLGQSSQPANQQQAQQYQNYGRDQYDQRGAGRRRASRGGRGGGPQHSPMNSPNAIPVQPRLNNSSKPMSPPLAPSGPLTEPKKDVALQAPATNIAAAQDPEQKSAESNPFDYEHITKETLVAWVDIGRRSIVEAGVKARMMDDAFTLGLLFQELVRSGIDRRISATDAGTVVKEILGEDDVNGVAPDAMVVEPAVDASSQFLDCLSIFAEGPSATPSINASLNTIILATGISPSKMRLELETSLLVNLGMIRSTFVRAGIRQITNFLYRQSNYNLLREETEGYSKLVTELFTTSSNEPPTSEVVEETFERVKGMIGAFDLDVGRVLDITLDVFAAVLVKQYRFFVKYLRASSWWPQDKPIKSAFAEPAQDSLPRWALPGSPARPLNDEEKEAATAAKAERDRAFWERSREIGLAAFFELGGRRVEEATLIAATSGSATEPTQDDEDRKWIEITKTLPPPGNKVAAQVLGFKLRFYSSSARDPVDVLPVNLIYLAALLIKVGFISLRDLYPHIWPADPDMENVREEKMKEKAERERSNRPGGGALNALLAAAPLPDDTIDARENARLREADAARRNAAKVDQTADRATPAAQPEDKADELPEPSEQKVQLLKSLLCIGALPEALFMLGRFPWLPDAFPELPDHIHRILHHSLSKVYEPLRPLNNHPGLRDLQKLPDPDQTGAARGEIKLMDAPARKTMRWAQLDKEDTNEAIDYKFYWDDWADSVPVCQNVDDVFTLCSSLLNLTGVKIGQDTALLLKLVRIGSHSLATDNSVSNLSRWIDLSKRVIVPAVSLTKCKPGAVNEVFELINRFSTPTRYNIYAEWYSGQTSRLPDMKAAFDQAKAETKDVLKRISKTTLKPMARALSKVAYANPGIVFAVAIAQLESYDNIVDAVVDCARYFTFLAYDVLIWSLMSALGGTGRNRIQTDGMLTSKWLAALSLFAGKVFKKYSVLNPTPIIQYVADQLRRGNSTDLIVLEEITKSMAGIISDTNFNEAQVLAMAGGELLQAQTLLQLFDQRHESKNTAKRLMRSLTDSKLAGQILVLLAQERQTGIYRIEEQNAHPKLLGNLADQLHRILVQYTDLLRSNLSVKDFDVFVPGVAKLVTEFGIDPSIAFWISRPSIATAVAEYDAKNGKRKPDASRSPAKETAEGSIKAETESAADRSLVDEGANPAPTEDAMDVSEAPVNGAPNADSIDTGTKEAAKLSPMTSPPLAKTELVQQPWHPILQELMEAIRPALPQKTWETLSLPFYVTFWSLSLSDMDIAATSYQDENGRQQKKIKAISDDRQDVTRVGTARKDLEKKAISDLQDRLSRERESRVGVYASVRKRMMKERNHWFSGTVGNWEVFNVALIEQCFFPRIVISPLDALYTFKMFTFLHTSGATNFRTMGVLDQSFKEKRLTSMMFLCTAKEAENLGRFLNEMLRYLSRWHTNKKDYEKEAFGVKKDLPGFTKRMGNDKSQYAFLDYEDFRRLLLKWHRNLSFAIKVCIGSGEYMHIRNAVNVLNNINQHFPAVNWMGKGLLDSITDMNKSESREDLKVAAMSLMGALKRREKDWVLPQAFSLAHNDNGASNTAGTRSASAKPSTPRPNGEGLKTLNPTAPEFQPSPRESVNGIAKMDGTSDKIDAEDGEIEDAKMTDAPANNGTASNSARNTNRSSADTPKPSAEPVVATTIPEVPTSPRIEPLAPRPEVKPTPPPTSDHLPPTRPDVDRSESSGASNGRAQHNLPSKPEPSQPRAGDHRLYPRASDRGPHDYARDARYPERGEPRELLRDRGQDRSLPGPYSHSHERAQAMERDRMNQRWNNDKAPPGRSGVDDRHGEPHARDSRYPARDERTERPVGDRQYPEQHLGRRDADTLRQQPRDTAMPPPRQMIPQHPVDPARAALIHGQAPDRGQSDNVHPDRRADLVRPDGHTYPERRSRGPSPLRADDLRATRYSDRPPMNGRRPIEEAARPVPPRFEEPHAPTGPRTGGRPASVGSGPLNSSERFRDSMKPSTAAPPVDPNHGRLSHDSSFGTRQPESQYGRLTSDNDIPSGPRLANGNHPPPQRGGRNISAPQPQLNTQLPPPSSGPATPVQERQAPSGPSMRGSPRKPPPFPPNATISSAPPTPAAQSPDTAGIHPDRLKALQGVGAVASESQPQSRIGSRQAPPPVSMPPRGPNNNLLPSPVGPSANNRGPPTGPSMPNDRSGRDKRTFAGIQNVLQQAGAPSMPERSGQGASIRGRGGRANNVNGPSPVTSASPTPGFPRPDQQPSREDLFAGRPNGPPPQQSEDDTVYGRGGRHGAPQDGPRDGDRRSDRHRSRSAGKGRQAATTLRMREGETVQGRDGLRDYRARGNDGHPDGDLRGGPGALEGNIGGGSVAPEREGRDRGQARDGRRRDDGQYRERDQREGGDRREERDRRDGGGSGRKRGRGDEGQNERNFSDSKRARR